MVRFSLDPVAEGESRVLGLDLGDRGAGGDALGDPDVAADHRAAADRDAPEDGGAGVDHDVVFDERVPWDALLRVAVRVDFFRLCLGAVTM